MDPGSTPSAFKGFLPAFSKGMETTIQEAIYTGTDAFVDQIITKPIPGEYTRVIWMACLVSLIGFGIVKIWNLFRANSLAWPIKAASIYLAVFFYSSFCLYQKAFYFGQITANWFHALDIFSTLFVMIMTVTMFWIFLNQCAAGSRAMLIVFGTLTLAGAIFIPLSIFHKGDTFYALGVFAVGLVPFVLSLFKSSKEFCRTAKEKMLPLPKYLKASGLIVLGVLACVIAKDIVSYPAMALIALISLPFLAWPFYWALRWGDGLALRYYQFLLSLFAVLDFLYISVALKHGLGWLALISDFTGLAVCVISLALTFHPSVRTWSKQLRPVFK